MQPLTDIAQMAQDQLDNLTAIKGEGYARIVQELINARSTALVVSSALSGETAGVAAMMMISLQKNYLELLAETLGLKDEPEMYEWADRIYDSVARAASLAQQVKGKGDSLH